MGAGGLVVAELGGTPSRRVERVSLPSRLAETADEREGALGVGQGPPEIAVLPKDPGERELHGGLDVGVVVLFGQGERLVQVRYRLLVAPHRGIAATEVHTGTD